MAALILAVTIGLAVGIGAYTFVSAKGASYLTNDPRACVNCHIMREQYDGWNTTKAINGFWHSVAFTSGRFHEPIEIGARNRRVTEGACRDCHQNVVDAIDVYRRKGERMECIRCHRSVGHLQ